MIEQNTNESVSIIYMTYNNTYMPQNHFNSEYMNNSHRSIWKDKQHNILNM